MVSDSSILIQSSIVTTFCNLESDARDEFSTTKRLEVWTEIFGDKESVVDPKEECWALEQDHANTLLAGKDHSLLFPNISLTLVQYRPAWIEQLVLRIANIPHIVINSSYSSQEATGPLPYLQHCDAGNSEASSKDSDPVTGVPILVGRHHPKGRFTKSGEEDSATGNANAVDLSGAEHFEGWGLSGDAKQGNSILRYLQTEKKVDLDSPLKSSSNEEEVKSRLALSKLLSILVTAKLQKSLMILRYEDKNAWSEICRKQCFCASKQRWGSTQSIADTTGLQLPTFRGLFQAWSERVMARKSLLLGGKAVSTEEAKAEARGAYEILEHHLGQRERQEAYLLGTKEPVMVDVQLWAHLAEALCDVNLALILADFPLLVQYFQRIYYTYFSTPEPSETVPDSERWKVWNKHQNLLNPFHKIPMESDLPEQTEPKKCLHALDLMQTLSVREHDLLRLLIVGKEARSRELFRGKKRAEPEASPADRLPKEPESKALEKARRQQQRHDQYWISLVAGCVLVAGVSSLAKAFVEQ